MRYVRMFLLHVEDVFESRSRSFVWFLMSIFGPLILILFWKGAAGNKMLAPGWNFSAITSYYLLLTVASSVLISHTEENISHEDIKEGMLVMHLLRPFPYYLEKFMLEIPYRLLQGSYGMIFCGILFFIFGFHSFIFAADTTKILFAIIIVLLGIFISFTLRVIMGISAFWFVDTRGLFEAIYATEFVLGGAIMPLILLPNAISLISYILPFSYILYFPVASVEGKLGVTELFLVVGMQIVWLCVLALIYKVLWRMGIKKFSGVGQ